MSPDEIRGALLRVVPPLTAPPDRMAEVSRRIARRRARRAALAAAVVAGLVVGTPAFLAAGAARVRQGDAGVVDGAAPGNAAPPPPLTASGRAPDGGGAPRDGSPPAAPSGSGSSDGVGTGRCPATLDLISQPPAWVAGDTDPVVKLPLTRVTVCRYRQHAFDWSVGPAARIAGPRDGTPEQFGNPVNQYLEQRVFHGSSPPPGTPSPGSSPPTSGCLYPSPWRDISVDVVFTVDATGVAREYRVGRISCANNPPDPARQLEAAVDRVLGPPY
jgi:hypothetical protein